jgi:hypothetical protein
MNPEAKEYLDKILEISPEKLNAEQIAFLRARRMYLKTSQLEEYKSVLNQTPPKGTVKKHAKTQ